MCPKYCNSKFIKKDYHLVPPLLKQFNTTLLCLLIKKCPYIWTHSYLNSSIQCCFVFSLIHTGEFTKRVWEMQSQLFVTLYTLSIYPSAQKQLRRHLPNHFREFPCTTQLRDIKDKRLKIFANKLIFYGSRSRTI